MSDSHKSTTSTLAPEAEPAFLITEKLDLAAENHLDTTDVKPQEAKHEMRGREVGSPRTEKKDGDAEVYHSDYPSSWKLFFIIFALSVSVLCMALVSIVLMQKCTHPAEFPLTSIFLG
jgi:hypothetical protein